MKRIFALILTCCLLFALAGCGAKDDTAQKVHFTFVVTHDDGTEKTFEIETEKKTLGEALLENNLVVEAAGSSGLYDTVDGETAYWDDGEAWWCFSCNGESLMVGIDDTELTDGASYEAVFTRGYAG